MKASELITILQKNMEYLNADPDVIIQHPNDHNWNQRDVLRLSRNGAMPGYIGDKPVIILNHANTLLGKEMPYQNWRRHFELEQMRKGLFEEWDNKDLEREMHERAEY